MEPTNPSSRSWSESIYGLDHYGTIFGTLLTSFGIGAFIGPVFEGISVSSSLGYLPGFLLAAVVSLATGLHLLIVGRKKNLSEQEIEFSSTYLTSRLWVEKRYRDVWEDTHPNEQSMVT